MSRPGRAAIALLVTVLAAGAATGAPAATTKQVVLEDIESTPAAASYDCTINPGMAAKAIVR